MVTKVKILRVVMSSALLTVIPMIQASVTFKIFLKMITNNDSDKKFKICYDISLITSSFNNHDRSIDHMEK